MELYLHSPNTPSWRGAQLKHRANFIFILIICVASQRAFIVVVVVVVVVDFFIDSARKLLDTPSYKARKFASEAKFLLRI
jgi:hypothetical protein